MTHYHLPMNRKPSVLSKRISAVGFSAVAAAALFLSTGSAEAGPKELSAIIAELPANVVLSNPTGTQTVATPEQLAQAVADAVTEVKNKKLKPGVIAGEALKTTIALTNPDAGTAIATKLFALPLTPPRTTIAADAARTAATSKGANALRVPEFIAAALDADADVIKVAEAVRTSKTAVAAVIAGRASELTNEGASTKTSFAASALGRVKLAPAAKEIAAAVGSQFAVGTPDEVLAYAAFTETLADARPTSTNAVAAGAVSANPSQASSITTGLLASDDTAVKTALAKGMVAYAKAVATVADYEQISAVGAQLARQIGSGVKFTTTAQAAGLAKTLAQAILAKSVSIDAATRATEIKEKADEIAEVAAFVAGGIAANAKLTKKNINSTVLAIIKNAIAGSKSTAKALKAVSGELAAENVKLIADIVGSVALTLENNPALSAELKTLIKTYLSKQTTINLIAGKTPGIRTEVGNALTLAYSTDATRFARLENGNDPFSSIIEPETDAKNY